MSYVNKSAIEDWMSVYAASLQREAQVKVSESLLIVVSGKVVHVVPIIAISRENNHERDWKNCLRRLIYGDPLGPKEDISVDMVVWCTC